MSKHYERVWLDKPVMRLDNNTMTTVLQVQDGFTIERVGDGIRVTHEKVVGIVQEIPWSRVMDSRTRVEPAADGKAKAKAAA